MKFWKVVGADQGTVWLEDAEGNRKEVSVFNPDEKWLIVREKDVRELLVMALGELL